MTLSESSLFFRRRLIARARNAAKGFRDDRSGAIALLFALTLIPVVALTGSAIDYANAYRLKSKLQFALDSATHAVGREVRAGADTGAARQAGMDAFVANLGPGFPSDYAANFTIDGRTVTGTASLGMQTFVLGIVGQNSLDIGTTSVAYIAK
ncbi:MAG: TadE/TadG family type IV pilus assembly protein [Pseudomonadota bacterium]